MNNEISEKKIKIAKFGCRLGIYPKFDHSTLIYQN